MILAAGLGTRLRQFIPEGDFQFWFKLMVSVLALRMILMPLLS